VIRKRRQLLDVAATLATAAGGVVDVCVIGDRQGPLWANVLAMLVLAGLVWQHRRTPRVAGYGFLVLVLVLSAALTPPPAIVVILFGLLLFPFAVGALVRGPWSVAYVPAVLAVIVVADLSWSHVNAGDFVFPMALALAAYGAGRNVVHRSALAAELHEAALRAGEERDAEARRAVAAERRRIAREMHDVVAHSISMMVVQAAGGRRILERDPVRAREAAAQIERTGRETLLEMRRLLGVMRGPEQRAELAPNPTLDDLPALVDRARDAGLPVRLHVDGARRELGAGLGLAAYRVVEDALDDVLRTAPGTVTEVGVRYSRGALEVTVADERPGLPFAVGAGPELVGVRERVSVYGGELRTGLRPGGGHEVHVRFPIDLPPGTTSPDHVPAQGAA
jgi:signal transduction histidine kinase